MDLTEALLGIAALAVALAGFAGVAIALSGEAHRNVGDRYRIICLLSSTLPIIPLALLPLVLLFWPVSSAITWRVASALGVLHCTGFAYLMRRNLREYRDHPDFPIMYRTTWTIIAVPIILVVQLVQFMNAVGWPIDPNPGAFLLNLMVWVSYAAAVFADIIFVRPSGGPGATA
ncbi:MAG TPA: hypothetical protein VFG22_15305 [Polyangiales bacterium]|nr:hypothetical protein [Polyangiales bacterium]